jgi:hypothetical protein
MSGAQVKWDGMSITERAALVRGRMALAPFLMTTYGWEYQNPVERREIERLLSQPSTPDDAEER